jgi:hypothetical protein
MFEVIRKMMSDNSVSHRDPVTTAPVSSDGETSLPANLPEGSLALWALQKRIESIFPVYSNTWELHFKATSIYFAANLAGLAIIRNNFPVVEWYIAAFFLAINTVGLYIGCQMYRFTEECEKNYQDACHQLWLVIPRAEQKLKDALFRTSIPFPLGKGAAIGEVVTIIALDIVWIFLPIVNR